MRWKAKSSAWKNKTNKPKIISQFGSANGKSKSARVNLIINKGADIGVTFSDNLTLNFIKLDSIKNTKANL